MPDDKPEYRVYRSRPGFLSRLFNRRDASRFGAAGGPDRVRELSGDRPAPGTAAPEAPPAAPTYPPLPPTVPERALVAADHLEAGGRRRARLHRVLAGAQPGALHDQREPAVGQGLRRHQGGARRLREPAHVAQQHPGARLRPPPGRGARPRGHDHADALRRRQGGAPVDPARHAREHPGHRPEQDQRRLCDRRAGADDRDDQAVPRHRGEPPRRDRLQGLPEVRGRARRRGHDLREVHPVTVRGPHPPLPQGREPPQRRGGARHRADPQERVRARGVRPHARPPPAAVPGGGEGQALQPVHLPALPVGRRGGRRRRSSPTWAASSC